MRQAWRDVWKFCAAVLDRARFYAECVLESDFIDACIIILILGGILGILLIISGCFTSQWFARLLR